MEMTMRVPLSIKKEQEIKTLTGGDDFFEIKEVKTKYVELPSPTDDTPIRKPLHLRLYSVVSIIGIVMYCVF